MAQAGTRVGHEPERCQIFYKSKQPSINDHEGVQSSTLPLRNEKPLLNQFTIEFKASLLDSVLTQTKSINTVRLTKSNSLKMYGRRFPVSASAYAMHRLTVYLAFTLFVTATLFIDSVSALTLYKWIDAEGKVSYQDSPPRSGQSFEEKTILQTLPHNAAEDTNDSAIQKPIVFYFSSDCLRCDEVRTILQANKVPFIQNLIDYNPTKKQALIDLTGSAAVPVLTIGGKLIPELDQNNLELALRISGYPKPEYQ